MKLGKNEKKILVVLKKVYVQYGLDYPEGKSMGILAKEIYNKPIRDEYPSPYTCALLNKIKASLIRSLNNLWKKGLIYKGKPIYRSYWEKEHIEHYGDGKEEIIGGCMTRKLERIELQTYDTIHGYDPSKELSIPHYTYCLPSKTKIWWVLTDKGKEIAKKLALENPELDKLIGYYYKNKKEELKIELMKRCKGCWKFSQELLHCDVKEMQGIEYETEDCSYYRLHGDFLDPFDDEN